MKKHSFDAVSFVLGLLVFGVGVTFLSGLHGTAWVLPVALIGVGLAFAAAAIQRVITTNARTEETKAEAE